MLLAGIAVVLLGILGIWFWVWAPSVAKTLSLTSACLLLVYLYVVRFVTPLLKTNKLQFSVFDLCALVLALVLLVAHRRAPDAFIAMGIWPCTSLMFCLRRVVGTFVTGTHRTLFWAHASFFVLAMIFSAMFAFWLNAQWPIPYNQPVEIPVYVFLFAPAVLTMMTIQADLAVDYAHPSLLLGILVSVVVASVAATITSWATIALANRLSSLSGSPVERVSERGSRTNG